MKTKQLLAGSCLFLLSLYAKTQCLAPPSFPDCSGTETLIQSGDVVVNAQTKWFYGSPATLSNITLRGGTLTVCSDLTINNLVLDSGTIVVKTGGRLVVSNGAGLVLKGGCAIYNWGTFQCLGNIVMDYGTASATRPNLIINATSASVWLMANQYFVINNPYSKFVNMGTASFHGIITDPGAAQGSVCLGDGSMVNMMVLYNKSRHSYVVPDGTACLSVSQYSQFYDTLTASSNLNVCLGTSHFSDASCTPWGCRLNAWGASHVMNSCLSCLGSFTVLPMRFRSIKAVYHSWYNEIKWETENVSSATVFYLQYSLDAKNFLVIDSITDNGRNVYSIKHLLAENSKYYYRVQWFDPQTGKNYISSVVTSEQEITQAAVFPNPFSNEIMLSMPGTAGKLAITLLDMYGKEITTQYIHSKHGVIRLSFPGVARGNYLLRVKYGGNTRVFKIRKG